MKLNLEVKKDKDVTNSFSDNFNSSKEDKIYEGIEDNKVPEGYEEYAEFKEEEEHHHAPKEIIINL